MMCSIDTDNTELCLIDCGIDTLQKVPLRPHLQVLNLHSNFIQTLENLSHLRCLKHLDISANQIEEIEGLDGLTSLRTLNLSCNLLKDVRGLAGLRSLVKLNVSYNQIKNISGLKSIQGPDYKLTCVELHGNQISSLQHVVQCLNRCENLRQLILCDNGSSNPVCDITEYRSKILSALPQVEILDNVNRQGEDVTAADVMADIPGLEEYMDYLVSNSTTSLSDEKITEMITPKIDQAIEKFRYRALSSIETSADQYTDNDVNSSVNTATSGQPTAKSQESRLELLENQLAQLIQASKMGTEKSERGRSAKARVTKHNAKRDVDSTDECSEDSMKQRSKSPGGLKKRKSRLPGYRKSTMSSRSRKDVQTPPPASSGGTTNEDVQSYTSSSQTKQPSVYMKSDFKKREDVQSTYVQIMKELETERERRWKSEQATKKLLDHVNELQSKARDGDQLKDTALEATTKLKQALMNERETKLRLQDDIDKLKEHITEQNRQLKISKDTEESLKRSLKALEEVTAKMEQEKLHQHTHEQKKTQDAQMKAAALNRELELLRATSDKRKGQISQLQELLANREQQHREELKNRYTLDSQELKGVLEENVKKAEKEYNLELKSQRTNIDTLTKQYTELEDEFRMALEIEASRFKELEVAFETVSEENAQNKQALKAAQRKDENSSSVLNELTALVKEQKGRIAELSKSKQEQSLDNKERIQTLEAHVEEARKRMLQMELLKQDKTKLLAQVEAQESVISGLKAERKLWGQELAQQGASLAQDRGRLESKIEAYSAEISTLKKNLEREADALKIKTKMLEDQTETIRKLKEALLERDEEIKRTRDESLKMQRNLEEQLTEERANINDNQETLERLRERKQELKRQVTDIQAELEDSKKAHSILNNKWKEKSQLIGQLEKQVQEMKDNWEGKEKKLTEERNKAIQAANIAIEKLRTIDDAFRNQLDNKEQAHQEEMARLEEEKQIEIDQANQRVAAVEDEMRDLLQENQATKKAMEEKVKKLTRAMSELHSDLF